MAEIEGDGSNNTLNGTAGDDKISGLGGNDTIEGGGGNDLIRGGDGDDVITDSGTDSGGGVITTREFISWSSEGSDETNLEGGFTQNTGANTVTFSVLTDVSTNIEVETGTTNTTDQQDSSAQEHSANSALEFETNNDNDEASVEIEFALPAENLEFNISDLEDQYEMTILAFDGNGDPVPVQFFENSANITTNNATGVITEDVEDNSVPSGSNQGTVTVKIAGPVETLQIIFDNQDPNNNSDTINPQVSDIYFDTTTSASSDDVIYGGDGDDIIDAGEGDDLIYGDLGGTGTIEVLDWTDQGGNGTDLSAGFTQNTGDMNVTVAFTRDPGATSSAENVSTDSQYTEGSDPYAFDTNSSLFLAGQTSGADDLVETRLTFASATAGISDEVQNVAFRVNDIDWENADHLDQVTITAFRADGSQIDYTLGDFITLTAAGGDEVDDTTGGILAEVGGDDSPSDAGGSVLVEIPGPLSEIVIDYDNAGTGFLGVWVTDVHFETISETDGGADTIRGEEGEDTIFAGVDDDYVDGGADNDTISGEDGDDFIVGGGGADTIDGGADDDVIYGDLATGGEGVLDWTDEGGDGTDLSAGFTQDTGDIDVAVSFSRGTGSTTNEEEVTTDTQYTDTATDPYTFDTNSGLFLSGDTGGSSGEVVTATLDFSASAGTTDIADEVKNVSFRINDIDWESADHLDEITIVAYDADGVAYDYTLADFISLTPAGGDLVDESTGVITAETGVADSPDDADGSVLVQIPGPVSRIEIVYDNAGTGGLGVWLTDVHFESIDTSEGGDDVIDGGDGSDLIYAGEGDDSVTAGAGDEAFGEDGDDTFFIENDAGTVDVTGGEGNETLGDTVDFSAIFSTLSNPEQQQLKADIQAIVDAEAPPDNAGGFTGSVTAGGVTVNFAEIENFVLCFGRGTLILTDRGEVPIEELKLGDMVQTLDNGFQPIRWIGSTRRAGTGNIAPIHIKAGALGNRRDMRVSPQHRMLITGWQVELLTGQTEVLANAKSLVNGQSITIAPCEEIEYFHMLFDQHEIVYAEGALAESFHPGQQSMSALDDAARQEVLDLFPELEYGDYERFGPLARMQIRSIECRALHS